MGENGESIQTEKPVPPWERPGCFRRDCEPHRGDMLWWLANASLLLGALALVPCCGWLPGLVGIPLSLCSRSLAKADLAKMQAGLMDPAGKGVTFSALTLSINGLWMSILGVVLWGGLPVLWGGLIELVRWLESR
jgi:hypothetical protein